MNSTRSPHDKTHGRTEFVRTPEMEETVKDARQLMSECAAVVPEDECLKLIFGADYFWNKWKIKISWGLNKLWLWIFEDWETNLQDIGAPEKS